MRISSKNGPEAGPRVISSRPRKSENDNSLNSAISDATQLGPESINADNDDKHDISDAGLSEEQDSRAFPTEQTEKQVNDFSEMTDTQARHEVTAAEGFVSQSQESDTSQPFEIDEASQHSDAKVLANLQSRFDEVYLTPSELDDLYDRVFQSRREKVEAVECQWELWWKQLVCKQYAPKLMTPSGEVGKLVTKLFAEEYMKGNKEEDVPDARFLVCTMVILQKEKKKMTVNAIKDMMSGRVELWREGKHGALVAQALENEKRFIKNGYKRPPKDEESAAQHAATMFSKYMKQGNISTAMRWGMGDNSSNCTVFQPNDIILTKKGSQRVTDILAEKYPPAAPVYKEAVQEVIDCTAFDLPTLFDITPEEVERQASLLKGSAGPSGIDAANVERMLTAHGEASLLLREAIAERAIILTRQHVPWAKVRTMLACRQVALGARVGVQPVTNAPIHKLRPLGVGEAWQRTTTRLVIAKIRDEFMAACGMYNVSTGIRAGAEGIVHTMQQVIREAARLGAEEEAEVMIKLDASDAFNNLSRPVAMLHAGLKCPKSRVFIMNKYRGSTLMVARGTCSAALCRSEEGVVQGDPLAGLMYAVGTLPLLKRMRSFLLPPPGARVSCGVGLQVGVGLLPNNAGVEDCDAQAEVDESKYEFVLRFDGGADAVRGARGVGSNSGVPVGAGAVLYRGGLYSNHRVYERSIFLPAASVNDGEYTGVIAGLEACSLLGVKKVLVQGDSSVVLDQLTGRASANEPSLVAHYVAATRLLRSMPPGSVTFAKIRRDDNKRADALTHIARESKQCCERFYPIVGNPSSNTPDYLLEARGDCSSRLDLASLATHSRMIRPLPPRREASESAGSADGGVSGPSPEGRRTVQCGFADDITGAGPISKMLDWIELATKLGPTYGVHFNPTKTGIVSCDPKRVQEVQRLVSQRPALGGVTVTDGMEVLGCHVGTWSDAHDFIDGKVDAWTAGLNHLVKVGHRDPHGLYTAVRMSFLGMPTFVQRGMGGQPEQYRPIENVMAEKVLPALVPQARTGEGAREVYALPSRLGGLGITNITTTATANHEVAVRASRVLAESLLGRREWCKAEHDQHFSDTTSKHKTTKTAELQEDQTRLLSLYVRRLPTPQAKATVNAMQKGTHYFLVAKPVEAHNTYLSPDEFRDALAVRYGYDPQRVTPTCSHCQADNDLAHAMTCRHGGNRWGRHNTVRDEIAHLCRTAYGRTAYSVEVEPWVRKDAEDGSVDLRADVGIRGLDQPAKITMLDVRICHPSAKSYVQKKQDTDAVLRAAEIEKTEMYGQACRERGWLFKPFVLTTDGARGGEAELMIKRIGDALSKRWRLNNSRAVTWVRCRLATALARGCSACIRAPRGSGKGGGGGDTGRGGGGGPQGRGGEWDKKGTGEPPARGI